MVCVLLAGKVPDANKKDMVLKENGMKQRYAMLKGSEKSASTDMYLLMLQCKTGLSVYCID